LPVGTHELAVWDDALRALRIPPLVARATVHPDGSVDPVTLAVPSFARLYAQYCGRTPLNEEGLLLGEVRDLAGTRREGVSVSAVWQRTLISAEVVRDERVAEDTTDANGQFALCGLPRKGAITEDGLNAVFLSDELMLRAAHGVYTSDSIMVKLEDAPMVRRDLVVGTLANRARISGRVLDMMGRPIVGASVGVGGFTGDITRSDSSGRWVLDAVQVRSTTLRVRALRYAPGEFPLDPVTGSFVIGDVRLSDAPQILAAVTVRGVPGGSAGFKQAFEERRRTLAFGTFIDDETLARQPVVTSSFVVSRTSKARLRTTGDFNTRILRGHSKIGLENDFGGMGSSGAMSLCNPRWFIDGVDFNIPHAEEEQMWLRQAKRIEIYRASMSPPEYFDFGACGVVLIWTR
jgi:hypothetical protein